MSSRVTFRTVLFLLALVVLGTGAVEIALGPAALPGSPDVPPTVDSNYRFFAGIWTAAGIVLMPAVRHPERHGTALRAVFGAVFLGGLARGISYLSAGAPHVLHTAFIGVELVLPPLMLLWYGRLTRTAPDAATA
ncbi:DUF4345 domain-containing protein [Streptomyces sp. NPDC093595]|uniref:DUF4345 domain-containing protein n=1 Tax=Streptomyces sp. NPDC093595 TaxID=3366045 RepID=UPI0037F2CF4A